MPAVTCPFCHGPTSLPDPWTAAGYICPHCNATVALGLPPGSGSSPVRVEAEHTVQQPVATGCGVAFGVVLGIFAAGMLLVLLLYGGCVALMNRAFN